MGRLALDTFPYTGMVMTSSLDAIVTDSSPGMSNYVTGNKAANNQEGVWPDDTFDAFDSLRVEYLAEFLHRTQGKALGNWTLEGRAAAARRQQADTPRCDGLLDRDPDVPGTGSHPVVFVGDQNRVAGADRLETPRPLRHPLQVAELLEVGGRDAIVREHRALRREDRRGEREVDPLRRRLRPAQPRPRRFLGLQLDDMGRPGEYVDEPRMSDEQLAVRSVLRTFDAIARDDAAVSVQVDKKVLDGVSHEWSPFGPSSCDVGAHVDHLVVAGPLEPMCQRALTARPKPRRRPCGFSTSQAPKRHLAAFAQEQVPIT
jgi:hypothetical protein